MQQMHTILYGAYSKYKKIKSCLTERQHPFFRLAPQRCQTGKKGLLPKGTRNRKPSKISDEALFQDVKEYPDAFQYERAERLGASERWISHALRRLGITRKKRRYLTPKEMKKRA